MKIQIEKTEIKLQMFETSKVFVMLIEVSFRYFNLGVNIISLNKPMILMTLTGISGFPMIPKICCDSYYALDIVHLPQTHHS